METDSLINLCLTKLDDIEAYIEELDARQDENSDEGNAQHIAEARSSVETLKNELEYIVP